MKSKIFLRKLFQQSDENISTILDKITNEQLKMMRGIACLSNRTVRDVMVPRIDAILIEYAQDSIKLIAQLAKSNHSRIPIYKETIDNVIGILYSKDVLLQAIVDQDHSIEKIIRTPFFVPESKRLDTLLHEMQKRHVHMAIAVDEYGGTAGVICLEDIIEEIVGDIQDEFDDEREGIIELEGDSYLCYARIGIDRLNNTLNTSIPNDQFDTLGGFVFDLFGRIPNRGEKIQYEGMDFIIQDMVGQKIETVKLFIHTYRSKIKLE